MENEVIITVKKLYNFFIFYKSSKKIFKKIFQTVMKNESCFDNNFKNQFVNLMNIF